MSGIPSNSANRALWREVAADYAGEEPGEDDPALRAWVRGELQARLLGSRLLEVGCGPGTDAAALAAAGLDVVATDYAPEFVAIAKERYPELAVHLMDMSQPDLPPARFDGVYGFASFVHLPRALAARTLAGLGELLRPGGLLMLGLIGSRLGLRDYVIDDWLGRPGGRMGFTCYDEDEARALAEGAGLVEVELLPLPASVYDELPRLAERGVYGYLLCARRPEALAS